MASAGRQKHPSKRNDSAEFGLCVWPKPCRVQRLQQASETSHGRGRRTTDIGLQGVTKSLPTIAEQPIVAHRSHTSSAKHSGRADQATAQHRQAKQRATEAVAPVGHTAGQLSLAPAGHQTHLAKRCSAAFLPHAFQPTSSSVFRSFSPAADATDLIAILGRGEEDRQ